MKIFDEKKLIYDWNRMGQRGKPSIHIIELNDESLRDGLQSPSVVDPKIEDKIRLLHLMEELGIHSANIGLPGANLRTKQDTYLLNREIAENKMKIRGNCAARTVKIDITPIIEICDKTGVPIEAATFIGSSPIRQYAEEWTLDRMLKLTEEAITYAVSHGLSVMFVTEDTTRSHPDAIKKLYTTAISAGARRICVCDTVGHATPDGVTNLVQYVIEIVKETGEDVKIDWHGHSDRGLSIPNAIAAIQAGVDRVHGTALGIGERVGNVPMDILLVNLKLMGLIENDLTKLGEYCRLVSRACKVPIPVNYPVVGSDAFRTATGVHAAAVIKAQKKGDSWLADRIYSGVPAGLFGLTQKIEIGPMSGRSNVVYYLEQKGLEPAAEIVEKLFEYANESTHVLSEEEIEKFLFFMGILMKNKNRESKTSEIQ